MNKKVTHNNLRAIMQEATYNKRACTGLVIALVLLAGAVSSGLTSLLASDSSATTPATQNATFQVNVQDILSVAVTTPASGATGNVEDFLRNTVDVTINSNVMNGVTASMYSRNNTNLEHEILGSSYYIPTLSSSQTRGNFQANYWGYSLKNASGASDGRTYGETDAGNNSSNYYPLSDASSPITIKAIGSGTAVNDISQSIYFGAKANTDKPSGTYSNTVIISVVTGQVENDPTSTNPPYNPTNPTNPATPGIDPNPNDSTPVYTGSNTTIGTGISGSNGTTVYTTRTTTSDTTTTTTEVSAGDNRSSYAPVQGVNISTQANVVEGSSILPIGLAATAVASATAGAIFFVLAKRDDDEEEEQY